MSAPTPPSSIPDDASTHSVVRTPSLPIVRGLAYIHHLSKTWSCCPDIIVIYVAAVRTYLLFAKTSTTLSTAVNVEAGARLVQLEREYASQPLLRRLDIREIVSVTEYMTEFIGKSEDPLAFVEGNLDACVGYFEYVKGEIGKVVARLVARVQEGREQDWEMEDLVAEIAGKWQDVVRELQGEQEDEGVEV